MHRLAFCLLFLTQALAEDIGQHGHSVVSSEDPHIDDIAKDWIIPDSKVIYNFKQLKRDQPSHIETREEDIGKYIYSSSTTTPPTTDQPIAEVMENDDKPTEIHREFDTPIVVLETVHHRHHHHHRHSKKPNATTLVPSTPEKENNERELRPHFPTHTWDNGNYQSAYPAKMPPPPALPKWENLNKFIKKHKHQHLAHTITAQHGSDYHEEKDETTSITVLHTNADATTKRVHSPHRVTLLPSQDGDVISTTNQPSSHGASHGHNKKKPQHVHRGNHKFSGNDVSQDPTSFVSSPTATNRPQQNALPPLPVPTLSPWYDGYGK